MEFYENVYDQIDKLINFLVDKKIIHHDDIVSARNILIGELKLSEYKPSSSTEKDFLRPVNYILEYIVEHNIVEPVYRFHFIDKLFSMIGLKQSEVTRIFNELYKDSTEKAFNWFYEISKYMYFIKFDKISQNKSWESNTDFGKVLITINLSKPEKTQEEILAALKSPKNNYPKCKLCFENVSYYGHASWDSRNNLRYVPVDLKGNKMFVHYSPYGYFDHHLILNEYEHKPMFIDKSTFEKLLEFVDQNKFYFVGSNADLPIVGGSILNHNHFQGGMGNFPIFDSKAIFETKTGDNKVEILNWPISTIKLSGKNKNELIDLAIHIFDKWRKYSNENEYIIPMTNNEMHNTITPIVRYHNDKFEVYLLLRNNITTKEHPGGVYHFHKELWNIKSENIGLIEAAGQAILPGRLVKQFEDIKEALINNEKELPDGNEIHLDWFNELRLKYSNEMDINKFIEDEVSKVFVEGLNHCKVFKDVKNFEEFVNDVIKGA